MATFRVGLGSFNINDGSVGIGTEGSGHGNLKVEGTLKSTNLDVLGVSTFTRYSGFNADEVSVSNRDLTLSGEYSTTGDIVVDDGASLTVGLGSTACVGTVECISVKHHFSVPVGDTAQRNEISGYGEGTVRYNTDLGTMEFFNGNEWRQFLFQADVQKSPSSRGRVLIVGGKDSGGTRTSDIKFVNISTFGESLHFGNLNVARRQVGSCGSEIRALTMGGSSAANDTINEIHYYTTASGGDAIDFGDMMGNGSINSGSWQTPVNAFFVDAALSPEQEIQVVKIASKGNTVSWGNRGLQSGDQSGDAGRGTSNSTRGLFFGPGQTTSISCADLTSQGISYDFGEMTEAKYGVGASASPIRALVYGGWTPTKVNTIEYVTFATMGDGVDFGDATHHVREVASNVSDCHGGIGGY